MLTGPNLGSSFQKFIASINRRVPQTALLCTASMERVVDRSELLSEHSTPPASPGFERIKHLAEFEYVEQKKDLIPIKETGSDDELDFVLFAPSTKRSEPSQAVSKIRIQTPPPDDTDPGFVVPNRPQAYYFTGSISARDHENFEAAALSGQDVLTRWCHLAPGNGYVWKVRRIAMSTRQLHMLEDHAKVMHGDIPSKHKRPGKKARVKARTKLAATKASQIHQQQADEMKEAAEREKRTRRNREKKAKKKQREKAKKAENQDGDIAMEDDPGSE